MDIKINGTLSLIDGSNIKSFGLPQDGKALGVPNITEKDLQRTIKVAAGSTDVSVSLGGVDEARLLIIVSDQNISYKKNSSGGEANTIVVGATSTTDKKLGMHLLTTSGVTSLYFSNSGSESANVEIYAAN
jgi:hypothetical protein